MKRRQPFINASSSPDTSSESPRKRRRWFVGYAGVGTLISKARPAWCESTKGEPGIALSIDQTKIMIFTVLRCSDERDRLYLPRQKRHTLESLREVTNRAYR
jgi:hypothetical protein